MTEPSETTSGAIPPIEPTPAVAAMPPTHPPVAQPSPPQFAPPYYGPPQPAYAQQPAQPRYVATPRKRMSKKAVGWIVAGSILAFAGILAVIAVLAIQIGTTLTDRFTPDELATGEEATPYAQRPMECADECFGYSAQSVAFPSTVEFEGLGLTVDEGDIYSSDSVSNLLASAREDWSSSEGTPDSCFVTYPTAPITSQIPAEGDLTRKTINFDGSHSDVLGYAYFSQSERFFPNSASAVDYAEQLDAELQGCSTYELDGQTRTVTRPPALDLPDSVAAVGWVESADDGRYYVYDLQRGNLVVRSSLWTTGTITEEQFREVIEIAAERISKLRPE